MSIEQAYNFCAIDDRVSTSGMVKPEQLAQLAASGYQLVINLLPVDSDYAVPDEERIVREQGLGYVSIPVDFAAPTAEDYAAFVAAMGAVQGGKLLIHCAANYRVSAFYAIYAYQHLGWSGERAWQHIGAIWEPAENPPWEAFISTYLPARG